MASRWMQPKLDKIRRALMARTQTGFSHRAGHTIARSNCLTSEVATLVAGYTGVVTKYPTGKPTDTWSKRGKALTGQGLGAAIAPHKGVARNGNGNYYDLWGSSREWEIKRPS